MLIFDRKQKVVIKPSTWEKEAHLDEFLFEFPEALSEVLYADQMGNRLIPLGMQLWNTDVLFLRLDTQVNPEPALVVCEDKRGRNSELRRKVLAQAIDYVSLLTEMDDQDFAKKIMVAYAKDNVQDVVKRLMRMADKPLDESDAMGAVAAAISAKQAGRIEVVICGDEIPLKLIRMTHWLNGLVERRGAHPHFATCEVHPIDDGAEGLVALAATVAHINGVDAESLNPEELEQLERSARALHASLRFQVAIAELKSLGAHRTTVQATLHPNRPRSQLDSIRSVDEWLLSGPTTAILQLFESLKEALGPRAHWKPGGATGSQLGLWVDVAGLDTPAPLLRLKEKSAALIFPNKLPEFESCLGWARQQVPLLGAEPPDAAQPTFSPQRVAELAKENGAPLVQYINRYIAKIDEAVALDD